MQKNGAASKLDAAGMAYANLLMDPCNKALVHPTYFGTDTGYIGRYASNISVCSTVGSTAGSVFWLPGTLDTTGGGLVAMEAVTSGTSVVVTPIGNLAPGYNFLVPSSTVTRCVAACMKVTWTGPELDRKGLIAFGSFGGSTIGTGSAISADPLMTSSQHTMRTPGDTVEFKWRPGSGDEAFNPDSTTGVTAEERGRHNGICFTYKGLPSTYNNYFNIEMIAVYEWVPGRDQGLMFTSKERNMSNNTLDQVMNYLDSKGINWQFAGNVALKAATSVAGMLL